MQIRMRCHIMHAGSVLFGGNECWRREWLFLADDVGWHAYCNSLLPAPRVSRSGLGRLVCCEVAVGCRWRSLDCGFWLACLTVFWARASSSGLSWITSIVWYRSQEYRFARARPKQSVDLAQVISRAWDLREAVGQVIHVSRRKRAQTSVDCPAPCPRHAGACWNAMLEVWKVCKIAVFKGRPTLPPQAC